jgi:Tol biopolymer transport system component
LLVAEALGTENDGQLWILPLPTGAPRRLADVVAHWSLWSPGWAVWSPDGRQLAFSRDSAIYMANGDGTNVRQLAKLSGPAFEMRFSPDGTRLRFTLWTPQHDKASIWEVGSDGTNPHPLLPDWRDPPAQIAGDWSRDGRYYFFTTSDDPNRAIVWAIRENAGLFHRWASPPVQLTTGPLPAFFIGTSADPRKIFVGSWASNGELVRYDSRSHEFVPFLGGIAATDVAFSSDGQWVVYHQYPDVTLWRSRVDGSERLQLTCPPVFPFLPRWSPDGKQIAYVDEQGPLWKIFLISAQGGTPRPILSENQNELAPSWSPDGKQLAFGRVPWLAASADKIGIQILDLDSRRVATVPGSENLFFPSWSPNGQYLAAVSKDQKKLLLFDFKTQKWTDWINEPGAVTYPTWSRDGTYVYYDNTSTDRPGYRRAKVGQTRSELLIDLRVLHRGLDSMLGSWSGITPDGSALFARDTSTGEFYALELELP